MSDLYEEASDEEAWNAAICLIAADACLGDNETPEGAVMWVRRLEEVLNTDPLWANGRHSGDCTREPYSCVRCMFEFAVKEAHERYHDDFHLLLRVAEESNRFRSAVIDGDTDWVYKDVQTEAREASRDLVDLLAQCVRRGLIGTR